MSNTLGAGSDACGKQTAELERLYNRLTTVRDMCLSHANVAERHVEKFFGPLPQTTEKDPGNPQPAGIVAAFDRVFGEIENAQQRLVKTHDMLNRAIG